jgi:phosphate transport system substrate-binding protein
MMVRMEADSKALRNKKSMFDLSKKARLIASTVGVMMLALSLPVFAQSQPVVKLESTNGTMSITGELISVDDEVYTISGALGLLKIPRDAVECSGEGCPVVEVVAPVVTTSREVVLNSIDDETRMSGELVAVEEKHYVLRNALGEFRVSISNVECIGDACPVIEVFDPSVTILGGSPKVNLMLADLLSGYARATGQKFETGASDETSESFRIYANDTQELVADISLKVGNPRDAVQALSDRSADILVYEQQQVDGQLEANTELGDLMQNPLAFDGQVVIGHRDNRVRDLSIVEINKIWDGEVSSWRSLGGGDFPISIHMVEDGADTIGWLTGLRASSTPNVITHSTEAEVIEAVNAEPNALGVVHRVAADAERAKMLAVRKTCGLTAEPTRFGIRTQNYPFTQPIYSYGRTSNAHPFAQSFLEWTRTAAAGPDISKWGYVGAQLQRTRIQDMGVAVVHTAAVEPDFDGAEFATMMRELRSADRLSMTFRFLSGSTVLDEESVLNAKDLASRLRGKEFDGQEILLVGFADNTGPADRNTALSVRRANVVRDAVAQEFGGAGDMIQMGFGEQMPLDCNSTDLGRANNRRVEVWARVKN